MCESYADQEVVWDRLFLASTEISLGYFGIHICIWYLKNCVHKSISGFFFLFASLAEIFLNLLIQKVLSSFVVTNSESILFIVS